MAARGDVSDRPTREVTVTVNGTDVTETVEPRLKLTDFLRYCADQTDVKVGCEHGACGACTVELDGKTVKSCLLYAVQADASEIVTATGLNQAPDTLGPIQQAFHRNHGLQCGFCTNGFVVATKALLEENPDPSADEVEAALADNICRCTGYMNIVESVQEAAAEIDDPEELKGHGTPADD